MEHAEAPNARRLRRPLRVLGATTAGKLVTGKRAFGLSITDGKGVRSRPPSRWVMSIAWRSLRRPAAAGQSSGSLRRPKPPSTRTGSRGTSNGSASHSGADTTRGGRCACVPGVYHFACSWRGDQLQVVLYSGRRLEEGSSTSVNAVTFTKVLISRDSPRSLRERAA